MVYDDRNSNERRDPDETLAHSGPDGRFTFSGLPPGRYAFKMQLADASQAATTASVPSLLLVSGSQTSGLRFGSAVTVDLAPTLIGLLADVSLPASSVLGARVTYDLPTARDDHDDAPTVVCLRLRVANQLSLQSRRLSITGVAAPDEILVGDDTGDVRVLTVNGMPYDSDRFDLLFVTQAIRSLRISSGGGADTIQLDDDVSLPAVLLGGIMSLDIFLRQLANTAMSTEARPATEAAVRPDRNAGDGGDAEVISPVAGVCVAGGGGVAAGSSRRRQPAEGKGIAQRNPARQLRTRGASSPGTSLPQSFDFRRVPRRLRPLAARVYFGNGSHGRGLP